MNKPRKAGANRGFFIMDIQEFQIRGAEPSDYAGLQELYAQPGVIHGTLQVPFTSREAWRQRCLDWKENWRVLVACREQQIIGSAALIVASGSPRRRHVGEIGMGVHDAWRRRGVGSRLLGEVIGLADRWFNLSRIELTVYTDNAGAIALYEKFGFQREGCLQRYAFRDGEYADVFAMARLR